MHSWFSWEKGYVNTFKTADIWVGEFWSLSFAACRYQRDHCIITQHLKDWARIQWQPVCIMLERRRISAASSSPTARNMAQGHRHPYARLNSSTRRENSQ